MPHRSSTTATSQRSPLGTRTVHDPRLRAWRALLHAHAALMARLEAQLMEHQGMTMAEFDALLQLVAAPRRRLRMGELADQVLLSRSGVSRLVDRLEQQGLVQRERCTPDGRGAYAVLTSKGVGRVRSSLPLHLEGIREHFLDRVEGADLAVIERVMSDLAARNGRPLPWDVPRRAVSRAPQP